MIEKDKFQFKDLMEQSGNVFNHEISNEILVIYFEALQSFDIDIVTASFKKHLIEGKYFPKPAHIFGYCKEVLAEKNRKFKELKQSEELNNMSLGAPAKDIEKKLEDIKHTDDKTKTMHELLMSHNFKLSQAGRPTLKFASGIGQHGYTG